MRAGLLLLFVVVSTCVQAQDSLWNDNANWHLMMGVELRTDKHCKQEFNIKYLRKFTSFSLKVAPFNFEETSGSYNLIYNGGVVPGYTLGKYDYRIKGICIKPGYIFSHKLRRNSYFSHTLSAVMTQSKHIANSVYGNVTSSTTRTDFKVKFEYEFLMGVRLLDRFLLSTAIQAGQKVYEEYTIKDVLPWYKSYQTYAPVQGSSNGLFYLNATFGLGYIF